MRVNAHLRRNYRQNIASCEQSYTHVTAINKPLRDDMKGSQITITK